MTSVTQIDLDKQISRNRVISLVLLLVFAAGLGTAFYFYNELKTTKEELQISNDKLNKTIKDNTDLKKTIALQDSLKIVKAQQDEAIQLLAVFINDSESNSEQEGLSSEYILKNLTELAAKEKAKINKINEERNKAINNIFSNSRSTRKSATNELIREYGDDKKLVNEMLHSLLNEKHKKDGLLAKKYSESYYEILYILTQLSGTSLLREEALINQFKLEMKKAEFFGTSTETKFKEIAAKINKTK